MRYGYAIIINAFKVRGILNSHRNIKVHGNLIERCVKMFRIIHSNVFFIFADTYRGIWGTPIYLWNKAHGILSSHRTQESSQHFDYSISTKVYNSFSYFYFQTRQLVLTMKRNKGLETFNFQVFLERRRRNREI